MSTARLQRRDHVRVRMRGSDDDWTPAFVVLASEENPSSVMLLFDGPVRAMRGLMFNALPLTVDYEKETVVSLWGDDYEIEVEDKECR